MTVEGSVFFSTQTPLEEEVHNSGPNKPRLKLLALDPIDLQLKFKTSKACHSIGTFSDKIPGDSIAPFVHLQSIFREPDETDESDDEDEEESLEEEEEEEESLDDEEESLEED